jgi:hypothetical protein
MVVELGTIVRVELADTTFVDHDTATAWDVVGEDDTLRLEVYKEGEVLASYPHGLWVHVRRVSALVPVPEQTREAWNHSEAACPHDVQDGLDHRCSSCDVARYMEDEYPQRRMIENTRDPAFLVPAAMVLIGLAALFLFLLRGGI